VIDFTPSLIILGIEIVCVACLYLGMTWFLGLSSETKQLFMGKENI